MSNEPLGIFEEARRRRGVFDRFINKRIERYLSDGALEAQVAKMLDERLEKEISAIVKRRLDFQKQEIDRLKPPLNRPALRDILTIAAEITEREYDDLLSPRRSRALSWPRQFAYWLVKKLRPDLSLPAIGRAFGNRDHTSIMYGLKMVEQRKEASPFKDWLTHPKTLDLLSLNK